MSAGQKIGLVILFLSALYIVWILRPRGLGRK